MEKLFNELVWKCFEYGLSFNYQPSIYGFTITAVDKESNHTNIARGYLADWEWETPIDVLTRMHQEVDEYINREVKSHEG